MQKAGGLGLAGASLLNPSLLAAGAVAPLGSPRLMGEALYKAGLLFTPQKMQAQAPQGCYRATPMHCRSAEVFCRRCRLLFQPAKQPANKCQDCKDGNFHPHVIYVIHARS